MIIQLNNISKIYGKRDYKVQALNNINLEVEEGEMVAIMGASGSGKSTLLNIIGCLDKQSNGTYHLYGQDISTYTGKEMAKLRNGTFGFIVQDFALIERYSVSKNVELPLYYSDSYKRTKKQRVDEILEQVGLLEKKSQLVLHLSGGQRQRVAIARALVNNAKILLCDEPTGALDQKTGKDIIHIFKELHERKKTIIIVTHDPNVASFCDRIVTISDGCIS